MPLSTTLLARLLKTEDVLLSEAADPLFRCMMHFLSSLGNFSQALLVPGGTDAGCAEQEAKLQALRKRSQEWSSQRLHASVRGTRADQRHPLHSTSSGCLSVLQDWLYDSGMSHRDVQEAVAEEARTALGEALHTPLHPTALLHLPVLADMLSRASHWSGSDHPRMGIAAQAMLWLWARCSLGPSGGARAAAAAPQPCLTPVCVSKKVDGLVDGDGLVDAHQLDALMLSTSDEYLAWRVEELMHAIANDKSMLQEDICYSEMLQEHKTSCQQSMFQDKMGSGEWDDSIFRRLACFAQVPPSPPSLHPSIPPCLDPAYLEYEAASQVGA